MARGQYIGALIVYDSRVEGSLFPNSESVAGKRVVVEMRTGDSHIVLPARLVRTMHTLFNNRPTRASCRWTPTLPNILVKCMRAVEARMPSCSQQPFSAWPSIKRCA